MAKIIGRAIPNLPWEEKPAGCREAVWRYSGNPIIGRDGNTAGDEAACRAE